MSYRVIFMGTPAFAGPALKALIESEHDVCAVYTQPPRPAGRGKKLQPSPVQQLAEINNITVETPVNFKSSESIEQLQSYNADVAIVSAYGLLLPATVLESFQYGCINVHPSDLPRWRGAAPIQRTIMAGDAQTALCIIQMDEGLDTGDVLLREPLDIADDATSGWLHDIMVEKAGGALLKVLCDLSTITPTPQNENGATYAKKIDKAEAMIDWNKPADAVYNLIRGLNPYPGAKFICNGEAIKILSAQMEEGSGKAGEVLNNQLLIACEKGTIRPLTLQRPGKQPMPASEMLKGFPIAKGVVLS